MLRPPMFLAIAAAALVAAFQSSRATDAFDARVARFEKQVDALRERLRIPGMSAVIVRDGAPAWVKGFGFADVEAKTPATPDTLYHVASLTKTLAATLLWQLVEQDKVSLDAPISQFTSEILNKSVQVKHVLSHTTDTPPGERYRYDGNRYAALTAVLEKTTGKTFREMLVQTILDPLEMSSSVPGHNVVDDPATWEPKLGKADLERYRKNLTRLAKPYRLWGGDRFPVPYPPKDISASAGLLSTVVDMAKFDAAIDAHRFLKPETQERAWTPFVSFAGEKLPHAYGWFAKELHGERVIWHFGHWGTGFSATYVKVPARKLSLILIANSEGLSDAFYGDGGIETNAFAVEFLRIFVLENALATPLPDPDWSASKDAFEAQIARFAAAANRYDYAEERHAIADVDGWIDRSRARAPKEVQLPKSLLAGYAGTYRFNATRSVTVKLREADGRLTIDAVDVQNGPAHDLFAESETKFFMKYWGVTVTFTRDASGKTTALDLTAYRETTRATRDP